MVKTVFTNIAKNLQFPFWGFWFWPLAICCCAFLRVWRFVNGKNEKFSRTTGQLMNFGVRPRTQEVVLPRSGYRFVDSSFFTGDPAWGWVSIHSLFRHRAKCSKACDCGCNNPTLTPNTYSKLPVCSYLCIYCIHLTVSSDAFSWFGCLLRVSIRVASCLVTKEIASKACGTKKGGMSINF